MNPELPHFSPEELESKVTALLLGELPPDEADALRQAIAQDANLANLHQRLKQSIDLLQQAVAAPVSQPVVPPKPLKLSDARRQKLLAQFKTVEFQDFGQPAKRRIHWAVPMSIAAALVGFLGIALFWTESNRVRRMAAFSKMSNEPVPLANAERGFRNESPTSGKVEDRERFMKRYGLAVPGREPIPQRGTEVAQEKEESLLEMASLDSDKTENPKKSLWLGRLPAGSTASQPPSLPSGRAQLESKQGLVAPGLYVTDPSSGGKSEQAKAETSAWRLEPLGRGEVLGVALANSRTEPKPLNQVKEIHSPDGVFTAGNGSFAGGRANELPKTPMTDIGAVGGGFGAVEESHMASKGKTGLSTLGSPAQNALADTVSVETSHAAEVDNLSYAVSGSGNNRGATPQFGDAPAVGNLFRAELKPTDSAGETMVGREVKGDNFGVVSLRNSPAQVELNRKDSPVVTLVPQLTHAFPPDVTSLMANTAARSAVDSKALPQIEALAKNSAPGELPVEPFLVSDLERNVAELQVSNSLAQNTLSPLTTKAAGLEREVIRIPGEVKTDNDEAILRKPAVTALVPQPEIATRDNAFSTFSLNVSDVSLKLAAASLEKNTMPEPANIRSEEFINAFDYRDPEPSSGVPVAFAWERSAFPFAQNRDLLRFSLKTAAVGREAGRPLNLVLALDNSGSMERADRVGIIREALKVLAAQLQPVDKLSVITFARTARLRIDGVPGDQAGKALEEVSHLTPEGGTNLEEAMNLAYQTALHQYLPAGVNRVVILTDGAANLGNVEAEALKQKVEAHRKQGIALDCFGIGWEGYNDDLLEVLTRNGDGRYGFINSTQEAATGFAGQLAGALRVAASDVKVQVEFNPSRVTAYRQIGYAKHQLTKEQFRDNTVDAGELGAAESGNALYVIEVNPGGTGPLGVVRVRYKVPGTADYREQEWNVPFTGNAVPLEQSSAAMRLAATSGAFSEWLASSPFAGEVTLDRLLHYLNGVPEIYGADARPKKLEWMVRQAKSISGK